MSYRISGLPRDRFAHLFGLPDDALAAHGALRMIATEKPGYPCRVTLEDAEPGESLLLLNYEHLPVDTPYRSRHAIFVREDAAATAAFSDAVPVQLATRLLSVRAYDEHHMMTDADVTEGVALEPLIARLFADPVVAYLHVHNARRGCSPRGSIAPDSDNRGGVSRTPVATLSQTHTKERNLRFRLTAWPK